MLYCGLDIATPSPASTSSATKLAVSFLATLKLALIQRCLRVTQCSDTA